MREAKTAQAVALLRGVFVQSKKKGLESLLENQTPIENLAGLYLRHRDYKNAAPVWRELYRTRRGDLRIARNYALALLGDGQKEKSIEVAQENALAGLLKQLRAKK